MQALSDVEVLTLSTKNLQRMEHEFNSDFLEIFTNGEDLLRRFLTQKLRAIHNSSRNRHLLHDEESEFKRRFLKSKTMRFSIGGDGQGRKENNHSVKEDNVGIAFFEKSVPIKTLMDKSVSKSSCTENLSHEHQEDDAMSSQRQENQLGANGIESGPLGDQIKNKLFGAVFGLAK